MERWQNIMISSHLILAQIHTLILLAAWYNNSVLLNSSTGEVHCLELLGFSALLKGTLTVIVKGGKSVTLSLSKSVFSQGGTIHMKWLIYSQ